MGIFKKNDVEGNADSFTQLREKTLLLTLKTLMAWMKEESRITSLYVRGCVEITMSADFSEAFFWDELWKAVPKFSES